MNLTPVETKVRDACLALLAAGIIPAGPMLAARVPTRSKTDLIRIRNRLIAQRHLPAIAGRPPVPSRIVITEADRRVVLATCRLMLADGISPSIERLRGMCPGMSPKKLTIIRGELIGKALIKMGPCGKGLHGRTEAERKEVEERTAKIRKEKVDRGERPVEIRVCRDLQFVHRGLGWR